MAASYAMLTGWLSGRFQMVLVVELAQARGEFAGARAGRGDHDERPGGLDVLVLAVSVV